MRAFVLAAGAVCATTLFAAVGWSGCGASYQALYEGEVRFEHCYRLDDEPNVPIPQRRECWREWTQFYTYGQTRDRIEYALMRQRVLSGAPNNASVNPSLGDQDGGVAPTATLAAPAPTNLFAPPPQVDSASARAAPVQSASPTTSSTTTVGDVVEMVTEGNAPPGQACLLRCASSWKRCTGNCLHDNSRCRATCDAAFKTCGRSCI